MTTKTISTYYPSGYHLAANYSELDITATGGVGGPGVYEIDQTISNAGTIKGTTGFAVGIHANGGYILNQQSGYISGSVAAIYAGNLITITNLGTIENTQGVVIESRDACVITNGSTLDTTALISGAGNGNAIYAGGGGSIANFGTIQTSGYLGVYLGAAGTVTNGAAGDTTARIEGLDGVVIARGGLVANFGTISATAYGVEFYRGNSSLTNGADTDQVALIEGYTGARLFQTTAVNFGTISGTGAEGGYGIVLNGGGSLTNGAADDANALIAGFRGVVALGAATVTNFGTIRGGGGVALQLLSSKAVLAVEAGCGFEGAVIGGGGRLDLATGIGTIGLSAGETVTVSGSMAATTFTNFATEEIGSAAQFRLVGTGTIAAGQSLIVEGSLSIGKTLAVSGDLIAFGKLKGAGTLALTGGNAAFNPGASLTIAHVAVSGSAAVTVARNLTYAGTWTQSAGKVSVSKGDTLTFTGTGDSFAGALTGKGTVAFAGGSDTLKGTSLTAAGVTINGAAVTLTGAITNTTVVAVTTPSLTIAAAGATLAGGGTVALSDTASNKITGAAAGATLINLDNKISGAGALGGGSMILVNQAAGVINANGAVALTIDTGAATIVNAGLIEASGTGRGIIQSAVDNTGTLRAFGGTLTVRGAVTGQGQGEVDGGDLIFKSTFTEDVVFSGASGILELAHSQSYKGAISQFSHTGATSLDLDDIAFVGSSEATFSGTTASGTLTVTDGVHTASIKLIGDYTASTFVAASDGHGGTIVHDPAAPLRPPPWIASGSGQRFIAAMAGFGESGAGPSGYAAHQPWRSAHASLAVPRAQVA